MEFNERKLKILQAIIGDFIATAEPVGSRNLSKNHDLGISAATIRNEMSDLEEMGYLTHPHTSAGRVPSEKAYRLYVDQIMERSELPDDQKIMISGRLNDNVHELNKTLEHAANLLSEITNLTSFAMMPEREQEKLRYINIIKIDYKTVLLMIVSQTGRVTNKVIRLKVEPTDENLQLLAKTMTVAYEGKTVNEVLTSDIVTDIYHDSILMQEYNEDIMPRFMRTLEDMLDYKLYLHGMTNIFNLPEFNTDVSRAQTFLQLLENRDDFAKKIVERDDGLVVTIGKENNDDNMSDVSLITATYHVNGELVGKLGVIGPTRMKYSKITSVVKYLTENISDTFTMTEGDDDEDRE